MGPYLSKPKTDVTSRCEDGKHLRYCSASMQGWRKTQEDAHCAILNFDNHNSSLFAVFDGHGGEEVAKYCALFLPDFIKDSALYKEGKIVEALEDSFLKFDQKLKQPEVLAKLKKLASIEDADIDENETHDLTKEACMPLNELLIKNFKDYAETIKEEAKNGSQTDAKENFLLKTETLKAFLNDYISENDDEDDDEEEEDKEEEEEMGSEEEENGDLNNSSSEESGEESGDSDMSDADDDDDDDIDNKLRKFKAKNRAEDIRNMVDNEPHEPGQGSGCTAILAIVRDNIVYVANVGDSRCVLSRDGQAKDLSEDHKPEDENEKNRIIKAGGEISSDGRVNGGLNLSRAIGDHYYKNNTELSDREQMITALPDVQTCEIDPVKDRFMFLACDGIWNSMNSQEVVTFINEHLDDGFQPKQICEKLFNKCLAPNTTGDGSGCDNMTCILVEFKKPSSKNGKRALDDGEEAQCEPSTSSSSSTTKKEDDHSKKEEKRSKVSHNNDDDLFKPGPSRT